MYNNYTYIVLPDKGKVIALSTYAGKVVRGIAKCSPSDEFDEEYGKKLAAARCNLKVAEKRNRRAARKCIEATDNYAKASKVYEQMRYYYTSSTDELKEARQHLKFIEREDAE